MHLFIWQLKIVTDRINNTYRPFDKFYAYFLINMQILMDRNVLLWEKCIPIINFNLTKNQSYNIEFLISDIQVHRVLPLSGFTYYLTLYSEYFSTFPHGTCSLSVSWLYLALDGVYHQLSAALSSNTTLRKYLLILVIATTGLAPSMGIMAPFKMDLNV